MGDVIEFDGVTTLDVPVSGVLDGARDASLSSVAVIGLTENGSFYFASSHSDAAQVSWLCLRAIHELNRIVDRIDGK